MTIQCKSRQSRDCSLCMYVHIQVRLRLLWNCVVMRAWMYSFYNWPIAVLQKPAENYLPSNLNQLSGQKTNSYRHHWSWMCIWKNNIMKTMQWMTQLRPNLEFAVKNSLKIALYCSKIAYAVPKCRQIPNISGTTSAQWLIKTLKSWFYLHLSIEPSTSKEKMHFPTGMCLAE